MQVSKHLKSIWTAAFRAMDDIKETVRNSGDSLCRAVSSLTTRLCDISLSSASDASETMNIVLPFLLVEGIVSKVSSIQKASITIVMKLAKIIKVLWIHQACIYPQVDHGPVFTWYAGKYQEYRVRWGCEEAYTRKKERGGSYP
ncbi:hypothetical protein GW17_00018014 [Ensete ventricosum]|nr:hypothetical protein GW17_00018014 [Ensete ventricosum]RZS04025.1 hypothetical protein BHM03_00034290 [Ensete ventricosum]